mgnify:CR=1 FL=1
MEDEDIHIEFEKNEYIYKMIYLVRINLPSSELIYFIMFLFKYLGLYTFCTSLNQINNNNNNETISSKNFSNNSREPIPQLSYSYNININYFLTKFLITGNSLKMLDRNYQEICVTGFLILILYIITIIYCVTYMKNRYYSQVITSIVEKKLKKINNSSKFEKKLLKIITYIFFLIAFFHQYIIEYYLFGFIGYFLKLFDLNNLSLFDNNNNYSSYIENHFKNLLINPIAFIIINLITIILVLNFFNWFIYINSTHALFLNNGIPFYGNKIYLLIKIIIFNFNPLYGIINSFNDNIKIKITIIINVIICFIIFFDIIISLLKFSFYPSIFNYLFIFIELFLYFSNIIELVIYLTDSKIESLKFNVIKVVVILLNSFIFLLLFIYKKRERNLELFSNNLFNKTYRILNPDDIYYYIEKYIQYSKNKTNNYLKIFRLIQRHTLTCNKKDCPGRILIPKDMAYSIFTNFSYLKNEDNYQSTHKVQIQNNNEEKLDKNEANIKKLSETIIKENNNKNSNEINNSDKSHRKRSLIESYKNLNKSLIGKENIKCNIKNEINDSNEISKETEEEISNKIKKKKNSIIGNINEANNNLNHINNINIGNISNIFNHNTINNEKIPYPNNERKWLKDEHFQMIGEQEIINRINFLYKHKMHDILETYIFIHLQYLIKIKHNFRLALYFIGKYCQTRIKYSFLSKYYFYEIKKFLCKNLNSSKIKTKTKDPYIEKYKEENFFMKKFLNYINNYNMLKKLLKTSCQKIIYFFTFRTELHNSLTLRKYVNSKIYPVINSAEETRSSIFKLKSLLEKYVREEKHPFESVELSYLITNFFKLIEGKLLPNILKLITPILYFKNSHYEKLMKEFHIFMISHPLIISLTKKDTFNIIYFSNILADKLDYKYSELINSDFHEKLFPGGQKLIKEHSILIKQFLFFNKNVYAKENTFLKSKDGYLVPINFICKTFPNFVDEFYLISNIIFNDEPISELFYNTIEHNMKTNNFNTNEDKMVNIYSFILNSEFDFFGSTKNFFIEYQLNRDMFRELRINFCQFFCVDENKLNEQIIKEKKKMTRKYPSLNNKITLKELNKAYTIFQNIAIKNTFKIRQEKVLESYFYSPIFIYDRIDKKKVIQKVPEIMNIIDEIGLDYEWNIKLQNFKDRLIHNCHFRDIKESVINVKDHERFLMKLRNSTITDKNKIDGINYTKNPEQFFEVIYSIRKLGGVIYYLVYLHEKMNEINEKSQYDNENEENISRRNSSYSNNNNNPVKTFNKKNFSKINTLSLKKTSLEFSFNKPKTKNKVSFPDININKSSISNDKNENIEENNKKDSELNSKNINATYESKKDNNDFSQSLEIPQKIKINKNEYYDEENVPLITKDKFNEKISKYNKRNKIFIIIINVLIILALIILIIRFFLLIKGYKENKSVLSASMFLEMLKIDIYAQAVLTLIYCIDENHNITRITFIHEEAKLKLDNLITHLKLFQNQINTILKNKETVGIFETIEERFLINVLANDWTISNLKVDILYELRRLSYVLYSLTSSNDSCNLTLFYEYLKKRHKIYEEGYTGKANNMQKIVFYFIMNIFSNYQKTFDKLSNECLNSLEDMWMNNQNIIMYLLIIMQILLYTFLIFYIIKIRFDYSYYKILFLYYYDIGNDQLKFQNQIFYLYKVILDFNSENINNFEEIKNNGFLLSNNDINKMFTNFSKKSNNNINDKETKKKKKKTISKDNKEKNKNSNKKIKDKGSELNSSLNGSSFQFLNNSNKLAINNLENNNSYQSNFNEKEQNNNSQEESLDSLLKMVSKILPSTIKISLIFMIISIYIFSSLNLANIFEILNENKIWKFSINLSMNIMERIPKLILMILYSCMTVVSNNKNFIELSTYGDTQLNYLTYFQLNSLYYSEDIMNRYLKNTFFGQLLKDNLRINYNLANYLHQKENNIFKITRDMDKKLNKAGYFCIYAGIGDIFNTEEESENYEFIKKLESRIMECISDSSKINDSGVDLEINYILNEITNKYIEFITYNSSNIDLEQARENFLDSPDIKRIFGDIQYPFVMYYNTIMYTMNKDFDNQNSNIMKRQTLFILSLFIINFAIIIFLVFSIKKDEKYKEMFFYFSGFPKYNSA